MTAASTRARASGLLGFFLVLLGGGIVLDADQVRLGYVTLAIGAGSIASAARSNRSDGLTP